MDIIYLLKKNDILRNTSVVIVIKRRDLLVLTRSNTMHTVLNYIMDLHMGKNFNRPILKLQKGTPSLSRHSNDPLPIFATCEYSRVNPPGLTLSYLIAL